MGAENARVHSNPTDVGSKDRGDDAEDSMNSPRRKINRAIWTLVVLAIVGGFLFHFSLQIQKYFNYPRITVSSTNIGKNEFPDVTICSSSFFHIHRNIRIVDGNKAFKIFDQVFQKNLHAIWNSVLFNSTAEQNEADKKYEYVKKAHFSILPFIAAGKAGTLAGDFIFNCHYDNRICDFRDVTTFWHPARGACFTFKPANRYLNSTGIESGLELMLFGKEGHLSDDYMESMTTLVKGVMVILHPVNTWPDVENPHYTIDTSDILQADYTFSPLKKLNLPNAPCMERVSPQQLCRVEPFEGLVCRSFNVTDESIRMVQQQEALQKQCRCVSYEWPIPLALRNTTSCHHVPPLAFVHAGFQAAPDGGLVLKFANNTNVSMSAVAKLQELKSRFSCYESFKAKLKSASNEKGAMKCLQKSYEVNLVPSKLWEKSDKVSSHQIATEFLYRWIEATRGMHEANTTSIWETKEEYIAESDILKYFLNLLRGTNGQYTTAVMSHFPMATSTGTPTTLKQESISIYVYSSTLTNTSSEEVLLYDGLFFLADAGGILGLWIGFSLYTINEFMEWAISSLKKGK